MDDPTDMYVCPHCLTVIATAYQACPKCQLDLTWLSNRTELLAVLQRWAEPERCEICLHASWEGGKTEVSLPVGYTTTFLAGPLGKVEVTDLGQNGVLHVRAANESIDLILPGDLSLNGVKLSARRAVKSVADIRPVEIDSHDTHEIVIPAAHLVQIGRGAPKSTHDVQLPHPHVEMCHCLIVREPKSSRHWLVDNWTPAATFVNGRCVVSHALENNDLVQIGSFAWTFRQDDSSSSAKLVPAGRLPGLDLLLKDLGVGGHLAGVNLRVRSGKFVAITGLSGSGKSTLVRAIMEGGYRGTVLAGESLDNLRDVATQREWFRQLVGYVSQKEVIHGELTASDAVRFSAELRGQPHDDQRVEDVLWSVDLASGGNTPCRKLSGGESKRVRIAAELTGTGKQHLLLLDEPASGLDHYREACLMRMLNVLSLRGCTVIVVTHSLHHLKRFDQVLVLRKGESGAGEIAFWGPPDELAKQSATGDLRDLDLRHVVPNNQSSDAKPDFVAAALPPANYGVPIVVTPREKVLGAWRQLQVRLSDSWLYFREQVPILWRREGARCASDPLRRLVVPALILPMFFAVSVGCSVPLTMASLLGFLAILSCIWMGASLSVMAIVNEREILEHERLLFLRLTPYVLAKTASLWLVALVQTCVFVLILTIVRLARDADARNLDFWCVFDLVSVNLAAVGIGLIISALAGKSKPLASFVLPLVMMAQIVFSVQVATSAGDEPIRMAYRESFSDPKCDWARYASYGTLSRYGDIALRSYAYFDTVEEKVEEDAIDPTSWRQGSRAVLVALAIVLPILTIVILSVQARLRRFLDGVSHLMKHPRNLSVSRPTITADS